MKVKKCSMIVANKVFFWTRVLIYVKALISFTFFHWLFLKILNACKIKSQIKKSQVDIFYRLWVNSININYRLYSIYELKLLKIEYWSCWMKARFDQKRRTLFFVLLGMVFGLCFSLMAIFGMLKCFTKEG